MKDREKVMLGLEFCLDFCREGYCSKKCPYISDGRCYETIKRDALALLKEQEARVMTKSEVKHYLSIASNGFQAADIDEPPLWVEYKNPQRYGVKWVLFGTVYSWMDDQDISADYGKEFRFWTSRPTPEQMRDTPWEGESE